jgi:membrane protease YdiL (CAAX protease family)
MTGAIGFIGGLVLIAAYLATIKQSIRERLGDWLVRRPLSIWLLPASLLACYMVVAAATGQRALKPLAVLAAYFAIPTLLVYLTGPKSDDGCSGRDLVINACVVLWIWLPIEFGLVPTRWLHVTIGRGTPTGLPLGIYAALVYSLTVLSGWRRFDLKCDLSFKKSYLVPIVTTFEILGVVLILITMSSGFVQLRLANLTQLNLFGLPLEIAAPLTLIIGLPVVVLGLTLAEELIFRGAIQNLLARRLPPVLALVIASVVFGLAHVNNTAFGFDFPNWPYVGLATLAGLGYGFVFLRTQSIVASATLHALIALASKLFLRGGCA